ncbi:EAL domain-containing protein [Lysobacter korlensis]|uniref:EAL domain-containing protein n=1 Tax=Lysobacter korlensis TaxID=553636 RepID=A0ABV6RIG3_9GAMM
MQASTVARARAGAVQRRVIGNCCDGETPECKRGGVEARCHDGPLRMMGAAAQPMGRPMQGQDRTTPGLLPALALAMAAYHLGAQCGGRTTRALAQELAQLRASNARLQHAERLAGIGQYVWNVDTGTLWWSQNCYRIYGLDPDDGIRIERAFDAIHPDDRDTAQRVTEAVLKGGRPTEIELRIVQPDGSVRHMLSSGEAYVENGERHVFGVMKDVTELEDARRRLLDAQANYQFLFDHNPIPMWLYDREQLTFLAVNEAALTQYGYSREELIGQSLSMIRPPEEAAAAKQAAARASSQQPQGRVWTHLLKDRSRRRMAVFTHDIEFEGRPARLVAVQDVTERERSEERFRLIARATSDAVFDLDLRHGELWWSDSLYALFGYEPDALHISRATWQALVHPDDIDRVTASFEKALASTSGEWRAEYRFLHARGEYVQVLTRGMIQRDSDGAAVRMVGGMLDVTDTRRYESMLRLLQRAVDAADNGLLITDACAPDHPVVYANPAFERMTGYAPDEILGRNPRVLQGDDRDQPGNAAIRDALAGEREVRALLRNYRKDGTLFWNEMYLAPVRDETGALTHFVGVLNDVSDRQQFEDRLAHRATHDTLTGLPNRVLLEDRLQQTLLAADRAGECVVVVFIDLDDFKLVNDSLGHGAGDLLLREVGRRLQAAVREADTVGRFGGDEFVAVLGATGGAEQPAELVARLMRALVAPMQLGDVRHLLSASTGYCVYPGDGHDASTLLRRADQAMYEAKRRGRNRAVAYRPAFDATLSRRLQLIHQLRDALERDEFELAFQPQVAADGEIAALEALVRWRHPARGLLLPAEFIAVCEDSGLIVELGRRILRDAVWCQRRLAAAGFGHIRIAVNVSAAQFTDDLYDDVAQALHGRPLADGGLDLELTERVIMDSPAHAIELMQRLAGLGVSFSIDDFGTGYSSLAYLKRFPIQRLKIDRSFVQDLGQDASDAAICQSIISLARALDLHTVAEGVETEQQRDWLRERGCEELQGYLWGKPQPFETLLPALQHGRWGARPHA